MNDLDAATIEADRIRSLQARYPSEHQALLNWGAWSRDRCIGPRLAKQHLLDAHDGDVEGYGEDPDSPPEMIEPAKMERPQEQYEEKRAVVLDERMHASGGLGCDVRKAVRAAYFDGGPVESRWYVYAGCVHPDHFLERLEVALKFTRRFL